MAAIPDPTMAGYIARLKVAVILAESWVKGDSTLDVAGAEGVYPSLAKLSKTAQDKINNMLTNPSMVGTGGFTPPVGTTLQREENAAKGRTRYNSVLDTLESLTKDGWLSLENIIIASYHGNVVPSSGTIRIPFDNTPPLIVEGAQLWSKTVLPQAVGSVMAIDFSTLLDNSVADRVTLSLYRNNTLLAVTAVTVDKISGVTNGPCPARLFVNDTTTSLLAVTYSCRIGNTNGTWYQGRAAAASYGGAVSNGWSIQEVLQ